MNEMVMTAELAKDEPASLSPIERVQFAWALLWPVTLFGIAQCLVQGQSWLSDTQLQIAKWVFGTPSYFYLTAWAVRRTVRMDFPGFRLMVMRGYTGEGSRKMTLGESLSVAWLITWRSTLIFCLFYFPGIAVLGAYGGGDAVRRQILALSEVQGFLLTFVAEFLIFYLWIVNPLLRKRYRGFSLKIER